jgi:hypothetical protein
MRGPDPSLPGVFLYLSITASEGHLRVDRVRIPPDTVDRRRCISLAKSIRQALPFSAAGCFPLSFDRDGQAKAGDPLKEAEVPPTRGGRLPVVLHRQMNWLPVCVPPGVSLYLSILVAESGLGGRP